MGFWNAVGATFIGSCGAIVLATIAILVEDGVSKWRTQRRWEKKAAADTARREAAASRNFERYKVGE